MTHQNRLVWCDAIRLLAFFMLLCCHAADPFYASAAYASAATATDPEEVQWAIVILACSWAIVFIARRALGKYSKYILG